MYSSSYGVQAKFCDDSGFWLKQDLYGYESASEYVASKVAKATNLYSFVDYLPVKLDGTNWSKSKNFIPKDSELFTAWRIIELYDYTGEFRLQSKTNSTTERIQRFVDLIASATGITDFGFYFTQIVEFDSLLLNSDRHLKNICFLRRGTKFTVCPVFDNGAALLSNLQRFPLEAPTDVNIQRVKSAPFSSSFTKQVSAVRNLYGSKLVVNRDLVDIDLIRSTLTPFYRECIVNRIIDIIRLRLDSYLYDRNKLLHLCL